MKGSAEARGATVLKIGDWHFEPASRRLWREARSETLPLKVAEVLQALAAQPGVVVGREQLIEQVWLGNAYTGPRGLTNAIWQLRRLFDDGDVADSAIETIAKTGYRLTLPVLALDEPAPRRRWIPAVLLAVLALGAVAAALRPWHVYAPPLPTSAALPRPESLTEYDGMEEYPNLSPDGRWLAFTWEREDRPSQIYARDLRDPAAPLRQLTLGADSELRPVLGPGGQSLAFARVTPAGDCTVWVRDLRSFEERRVAACFYERLHAIFDWSPDGRTFAIAQRDAGGGTVSIFLYDIDGRLLRRLTQSIDGQQDSQMAFSHDGRRLAFVRRGYSSGELYVADLASGQLQQLTHDGAAGVFGLTWLAGDRELAFNSTRDGNFAIWHIAAAGGEPRLYSRLESPFNMDSFPGGGIVVAQHRTAEQIEIRSLRDGSLASTISSSGRDLYAQWLAGLQRILLISTRSGRLELWSTDATGRNARRLPLPRGTFGVPAAAPLGSAYAVAVRPFGARHDALYLGDDGTRAGHAVLEDAHDYQNVSFEPDGRALIVSSNRSGSWQLWRYAIDGGALAPLTQRGGVYGQRVADGLYHTRPGMPGLWRLRIGSAAEPERVLDALGIDDWGNWRIRGDALYYVLRTPTHDRLMQRSLRGGAERAVVELPRNAIRIYNSIALADDERVLLTVLGRRQTDLVALRGD
ncbi:winged helix-turn-helix domain-containing protein [Solimonas flava]|uniref:winged helix-turn-helix domain-containing protein n=1 Tax=Solimonas flava TaxID=415849 RepID=UPI0004269377|nr:winged helix-turn-helix domain-containing protein [Solimonas flava]